MFSETLLTIPKEGFTMNNLTTKFVSLFTVMTLAVIVIYVIMFSGSVALADNAVKQHPCDSIKDHETEAVFIIKGRAEDAKWGWSKVSDVVYCFVVKSKSEILSNKPLKNNGRVIVEKRSYEKAMDRLLVTPVDFKLRLDTIPMDEIRQLLDITAVLTNNLALQKSSDYLFGKLKELDNKSLGKIFEKILKDKSVKNAKVIDFIKRAFMNEVVLIKEFQGIRNLIKEQKNTFKITWYFDEDGNVTDVIFRHENGSLVTDEETNLIIRRGTLLIDYGITELSEKPLKDRATRYIKANDIQSIFDPFVDGNYCGLIKVEAHKVDQNEWKLDVKKSRVTVESKSGTTTKTTGELDVTKGSVIISNVNKENTMNVFDLKNSNFEACVEGNAQMVHLSNHHWLFKAKFSGDCKFRGEMTSKVIEK